MYIVLLVHRFVGFVKIYLPHILTDILLEVCGNEGAGQDDAVEQPIDRTSSPGLQRNHIQYFDDHFSFSKCYINARNGSATYYMHPLKSITVTVS